MSTSVAPAPAASSPLLLGFYIMLNRQDPRPLRQRIAGPFKDRQAAVGQLKTVAELAAIHHEPDSYLQNFKIVGARTNPEDPPLGKFNHLVDPALLQADCPPPRSPYPLGSVISAMYAAGPGGSSSGLQVVIGATQRSDSDWRIDFRDIAGVEGHHRCSWTGKSDFMLSLDEVRTIHCSRYGADAMKSLDARVERLSTVVNEQLANEALVGATPDNALF